MNGAWMLGSTIAALCFACAAAALEPVGALYRRIALRWMWVAALAASVGFMTLGLIPRNTPSVVPAIPPGSLSASSEAAAPAASRETGPVAPPVAAFPVKLKKLDLPELPLRAERALLVTWGAASFVLAVLLLSAARRLRAERAEWTYGRVAGTRLLISGDFGPAIVGVLEPEIVVPRWISELDAPSQRAIIAHEAEHLRARDPVLLLAGLAAVVLMPWNVGLWLCWRGLRRTIELDCDTRVLARGMPRAEYANVLLGAWQRARSSWLPSPAFAERASGLGKRVEHLMRPEPRRRAMRTLMGVAMATGFVLVASVTPAAGQRGGGTAASGPYPLVIIDGVKRPDLPPRYRYVGAVVAETTTTPAYEITYRGRTVADTVADKLYPRGEDVSLTQMISAPASVAHFGQAAKYGAVLYYTRKYRNAGGSILFPTEGHQSARAMDPATPPDARSQRVVDAMFAGITLTADQRASATAIADKYVAAQMAMPHGPSLAIWPRIVKITDDRNVAMRALLTRNDDLAKFDVHVVESRPRGTVTPDAIADNMYINLFVYDTITLTKEAQFRAHEIIKHSLLEDVALFDRAPDDFDGRVALRRKRDAELRTLLTSDRDRTKFDARAERTMNMEMRR